jgi:peptide/nickel transport system permease protein
VLKYIIKRILYVIPIMLGVLVIVFLLRVIIPGDPIEMFVRSDASVEEREAKRVELGLNYPIPVQFARYVWGVVTRLDFGKSWAGNVPVKDDLLLRFPITVRLAFISVFIAVLLAIPLGVVSAVKHNSFLDQFILLATLILTSIPGFWMALLLLSAFAVKLHWFPALYNGTIRSWILPVFVTAIGAMSGLCRITRTSMLEVIRADYVRTARAKGQTEQKIIYNHALRNALIPVLAAVGNMLGMQLGGAIITETMFGMPGIGKYIVDAIGKRDFICVQGGVVLLAFVCTMIKLLVDVSYTLVDPRLRSTVITTRKKKAKPAAAA